MKALILTAAIFLSGSMAFSQMNEFIQRQEGKGYYGGPLIGTSHNRNHSSFVIGGQGGLVFSKRVLIGGIIKAGIPFPENIHPLNQPSDLKFIGYGGLATEVILLGDRPVQVSIPVNILSGVAYRKSDGVRLQRSVLPLLEAGVNVGFNVSNKFSPVLHFSYRAPFPYLPGVSNNDFSGLNMGVFLRFGGGR